LTAKPADADETTIARLEECKERIAKVLSASMQVNEWSAGGRPPRRRNKRTQARHPPRVARLVRIPIYTLVRIEGGKL
jgi:hypothetical protein